MSAADSKAPNGDYEDVVEEVETLGEEDDNAGRDDGDESDEYDIDEGEDGEGDDYEGDDGEGEDEDDEGGESGQAKQNLTALLLGNPDAVGRDDDEEEDAEDYTEPEGTADAAPVPTSTVPAPPQIERSSSGKKRSIDEVEENVEEAAKKVKA